MVNVYGEVIGICTAIMRQSSEEGVIEGLNFAVPINDLKKVLDQLVALVK